MKTLSRNSRALKMAKEISYKFSVTLKKNLTEGEINNTIIFLKREQLLNYCIGNSIL